MLIAPLTFQSRFTLVGIGMGVFFPILSFSIDFIAKGLSFSFGSVYLVLLQNPIQWIILSAPLILGSTFYFMGLLVKKREQKLEELGRNEANQIAFIEKAFKSLEQGNQSVSLEELGSHSLSHAMKSAFENMKKGKLEEEKRQWSATGFTKFNEMLRINNDEVKSLCEKSIGFLVQHVGALQGAAFIWNGNENEPALEFLASYACNNIDDLGKKIFPNEGIVGQVFVEKQTQNLDTIPDNYITINSGLGISKPKGLVLIPLKYHEQVYGVFEIASFKKYEEFEIAFLEKSAEYVAVAIARIMNTKNILNLLEASTQKENEMRSQEAKIIRDVEETKVRADLLSFKLNESIKVNDLLLEHIETLLDDHKTRDLAINIKDVREQLNSLKKSFE